jgi:hypothetical protein
VDQVLVFCMAEGLGLPCRKLPKVLDGEDNCRLVLAPRKLETTAKLTRSGARRWRESLVVRETCLTASRVLCGLEIVIDPVSEILCRESSGIEGLRGESSNEGVAIREG